MLKNMKLATKLLLAFLAVGIIPATIISISSLNKSSAAMHDLSFNQLEGVQAIKKGQMKQFFAERKGDIGVLAETIRTLQENA